MNSINRKSEFVRQADHHLLQEREHDPYHSRAKLKEPTVCPECNAVFHKGRWVWSAIPDNAHANLCPACHRIHDKVPAGFLTISGSFHLQHKDEINSLIHNIEEREKSEHPLKRIMGMEMQDGDLVYSFTDSHLARDIGDALHHAYQGELNYQYTDGDIMLRVSWKR